MHRIRSRTYKCHNDCRMEGCPGHTITLDLDTVSDTVAELRDDVYYETWDWKELRVFQNLIEDLKQ